MPYCINEDCSHKKRTGKPAEVLKGTTECPYCGSLLSEISPSILERLDFSEIFMRVVFTIAMLMVYYILSLINVHGIDVSHTPLFTDGKRLSIVSLGIMPYISAYMITEVFSLFVPSMKRWRKEHYEGRRKLRIAALLVTLLLGLFHGYIIAWRLESMGNGMLVFTPGLGFRLTVSITLTAVVFLLIWITDLITSKGIGHGVSVIIVSGLMVDMFRNLLDTPKQIVANMPTTLIVVFVAYLAVLWLIAWFERGFKKIPVRYDDGIESYIPVKKTTAGILPATIFAPSLILFPATILSFSSIPVLQELAQMLGPGEPGFLIMYLMLIVFFYFFMTAYFYNSEVIVSFLKARKGSVVVPSKENPEEYLDNHFKRMAFTGALYLCFLTLLPELFINVIDFPFYFGGASLIILVVVVLDIYNEIMARKKSGNLIKVYESHDIPTAGLMKNILEKHEIPCHLKGYYHRALLYFLGPHIEVSALVPEDRAEEANAIINKYIKV